MKSQLNCVMLIDDDNMSNFLNKMIIDDAEITKTIVREYSGHSALKYLSESIRSKGYLPFPDLIFLDLNMPDGNGWDFIKNYTVDKQKFTKTSVIIMLTSSEQYDTIAKAKTIKEISALHFKPLTQKLLNSILTDYFPNDR